MHDCNVVIIHKNELVTPKVEFSTERQVSLFATGNHPTSLVLIELGESARVTSSIRLPSCVDGYLFILLSPFSFALWQRLSVGLWPARSCESALDSQLWLLYPQTYWTVSFKVSILPIHSLGRECSTANGNEWGDISLWTLETGRGLPGACRREACRWGQKQINY